MAAARARTLCQVVATLLRNAVTAGAIECTLLVNTEAPAVLHADNRPRAPSLERLQGQLRALDVVTQVSKSHVLSPLGALKDFRVVPPDLAGITRLRVQRRIAQLFEERTSRAGADWTVILLEDLFPSLPARREALGRERVRHLLSRWALSDALSLGRRRTTITRSLVCRTGVPGATARIDISPAARPCLFVDGVLAACPAIAPARYGGIVRVSLPKGSAALAALPSEDGTFALRDANWILGVAPLTQRLTAPLGHVRAPRPAQVPRAAPSLLARLRALRRRHTRNLELASSRVVDVRAALEGAQPIGQFLRSYIIAECNATVFVIDQHALAERINLERIAAQLHRPRLDGARPQPADPRAELFELPEASESQDEDDPGPVPVVSRPLQAPVRGAPSVSSEWLAAWGFQGAAGRITTAPDIAGRVVPPQIVLDSHEATRPWLHAFPPQPLVTLSRARACARAIKFGKALSAREMEELIRDGRLCKNPFICAHGRPSVISLVHVLRHARAAPMGRAATAWR